MRAHSVAAWIAALFLASCLFSGTVALRLMLLLAGLGACAWVAWRDRSVHRLPPIWLPFVLWGAWAALSLLWSVDPERSSKELTNEVIYTGLALWMCYVAAQARHAMKIVTGVVALASVGACGVALYYFFVLGPWRYMGGAHGGSGNHSSVLLLLLPCVAMTAWYALQTGGRRWIAALAAALAVLYGLSAYSTLSRTVWLAFGAQIILLVALVSRAAPARMTRARGWLILAAVVIGAAALGMTWQRQVDREADFAGPSVGKDSRFVIWREALERIEERPLAGYGFGRGLLRKQLTGETRDNLAWHSHNLFLEALLQAGLPGLLLLLALLGATLLQAVKMVKAGDALPLACGAALVAALAGMLMRNMTDMLLVRHIALLYWGLVGVLLAWGRAVRDPAVG